MLIRNMNENDLDFAYKCTSIEGWQGETKEVFEGLFNYDPEGCFIMETDDNIPVGICIAVHYGYYGFLGELIIINEYRGKGLGTRLISHAIKYLQDKGSESILLDGDHAAIPIYERLGFKKICKSLRFCGKILGESSPHVRQMEPQDLEAIFEFDKNIIEVDRGHFLKCKFNINPRLCKVAELNGEISGYIMGQKGIDVISCGPWIVKENSDNPLALLKSFALETGDVSIRIGVLESNKNAIADISSVDSLESQEYSWRMAIGKTGSFSMSDCIFAIGSAAKG